MSPDGAVTSGRNLGAVFCAQLDAKLPLSEVLACTQLCGIQGILNCCVAVLTENLAQFMRRCRPSLQEVPLCFSWHQQLPALIWLTHPAAKTPSANRPSLQNPQTCPDRQICIRDISRKARQFLTFAAQRAPGASTPTFLLLEPPKISVPMSMVPAPAPFQLLGAAFAPLNFHVVTLQAPAVAAAKQGANLCD